MPGANTTVARPYAEAAFECARGRGETAVWSRALGLLSAIVSEPKVARHIADPNTSAAEARDLLLEIAGEELPPGVTNLVRVLADNDRLALLPDITDLFESLAVDSSGVRQVEVRTAFPLGLAEEQALVDALQRRLAAKVELQVIQDASLLGGVEIRAGDLVIDGSVRGRLRQLANELKA